MSSAVLSPKQQVRDEIRARMRRVTIALRAQWSAAAADLVLSLPEIQAAHHIFLFASMPSEIDTDGIFARLLEAGKKVAFPYMVPGSSRLQAIGADKLDDLRMNSHGVREPAPTLDRKVNPSFFQVIIMPGMAFDLHGHRVGRGMGYYDRFIQEDAPNAFRVGLFYSLQEHHTVPVKETDQNLDCAVTEKEIRRFHRQK